MTSCGSCPPSAETMASPPESTTRATWLAGRRRRYPIRPAARTRPRSLRSVLWNPKDGSNGKIKATELRPFPGDSTSAATAINDNGQVVGISGDCDQAVGRYSARHAVLWEKNGKPTEIPNLGGTSWHTPM